MAEKKHKINRNDKHFAINCDLIVLQMIELKKLEKRVFSAFFFCCLVHEFSSLNEKSEWMWCNFFFLLLLLKKSQNELRLKEGEVDKKKISIFKALLRKPRNDKLVLRLSIISSLPFSCISFRYFCWKKKIFFHPKKIICIDSNGRRTKNQIVKFNFNFRRMHFDF